ncbi:MAG: hypothetical protein ACM3O8_02855 [Methylococcaceae bacterium]|nr:hypothetical protein [Prolixibacteraceae bacterium]
MEKHINVVAALQIGLSIFTLLLVILSYTIFHLIGGFIDDPDSQMVFSIIADVIAAFLIFVSIPGLIAGFGLYRRKEWARILTLVISVIALFNFPFGTAIGIYSIWALVQPETVAAFNRQESGQYQ